jgi:hypothetical protein
MHVSGQFLHPVERAPRNQPDKIAAPMRCSILDSVNPQHCTALYLCTACLCIDLYTRIIYIGYILYSLPDARSVYPHSSVSTAPSLRPDDRNLLTRCRISIDFRSGDRIPVQARFSAPVQTGPVVHPASCTMGTGYSPGVSCGRGVALTTHPI